MGLCVLFFSKKSHSFSHSKGKKMNKISRSDAAKQGLARYFTGNQCKRGHFCERYVASGACVECNKEWLSQMRAGIAIARRQFRNIEEKKL